MSNLLSLKIIIFSLKIKVQAAYKKTNKLTGKNNKSVLKISALNLKTRILEIVFCNYTSDSLFTDVQQSMANDSGMKIDSRTNICMFK